MVTSCPAIGSGSYLLTRDRDAYAKRFGWSVRVDGARLVVDVGADLDMLVLPRSLHQPVQVELALALLRLPCLDTGRGPVVAVTTLSLSDSLQLRDDVRLAGVRVVPRHSTVVLPGLSAETNPDGLRWRDVPRHARDLPPWAAVVGTVRRVLDRGRGAW
ncbi:hypothetical protein Acsp05_31400 [Actinokineospora sp. NBRC 105648]|nr:hypothetical protein Acsp05_31400 [Actinokineospora sp. NBRC 105648]